MLHKLIPQFAPGSVTMLSGLFRAHGQFCASHPWEVIIGTVTITLCLMSMSLFTSSEKVCGWNYICPHEDLQLNPDVKSSDLIIMTITRCLAVIYIYLQFRNLRRLGSKYLLGISGVFTIFSSFVFSMAVIHLLGNDLTGLDEALPFFLLLIDLSKASALARFALSSSSPEEVKDNIAKGMAIIGPSITLDAIVETLVIGVGTLSGLRQLETMCCFGCLSVIANYLAFMTFYPACLALVLELSRDRNQGKPLWQLQKISKILQEEEEEKKPNPVTQRVKIIMSAGLVLVHAHSRFSAGFTSSNTNPTLDARFPSTEQVFMDKQINPDLPLWQFYLFKLLTFNTEYSITLCLAIILAIKYVFMDDSVDREVQKLLQSHSDISSDTNNESKSQSNGHIPVIMTEEDFKHDASFIIGGDDSDDGDYDSKEDKETQTETMYDFKPLDLVKSSLPPRTLDDCLVTMKSDDGPNSLTDDEILMLVEKKHIPAYKLENMLSNHVRGVDIR
ncbi:3-hydroxy-3-methylglutaryl-coenzyme A reductase [Patella vulgata]|uniref:3-hydroxy-3-methylglutaryl-coenzyme A reductase n=1 Tax=Patella vulgata TaxID=6465 RepID=UPI00217F7FA5|nr:3-hydroxy-3-methylglutaryl-coenzyme A reductase [Patella vulgata]